MLEKPLNKCVSTGRARNVHFYQKGVNLCSAKQALLRWSCRAASARHFDDEAALKAERKAAAQDAAADRLRDA